MTREIATIKVELTDEAKATVEDARRGLEVAAENIERLREALQGVMGAAISCFVWADAPPQWSDAISEAEDALAATAPPEEELCGHISPMGYSCDLLKGHPGARNTKVHHRGGMETEWTE